MPNTIEDEVIRNTTLIKRKYEVLTLYIDAELSGDIALKEDDRPSESQDSHDIFITEDELEAIEDQS